MIIAGTISAYLKLSIDDFRSNLLSALQLLDQLNAAGVSGSAGISSLEYSAGQTAAAMTSLGGSAAIFAASMNSSAEGMQSAAQIMATGVTTAVAGASQAVILAGGNMTAAMTTSAAGLSGAFAAAAVNTQTAAAGITGAMVNAATASSTSMGQVAASVGVLAGAQATAAALSQGICGNVLTPMKALSTSTAAAGAAAGAGLASGLNSKRSAIMSVATSIANAARAAIEAALQIASPSKVMRRIGAYTVEGMALGMEDLLPRVADSASAVARTVERTTAAKMPVPSLASASAAGTQGYAYAGTRHTADAMPDLSALAERMDRLLDYFSDTEPVLRVDGRTLGRMVREYA